MLLNDDLEWYSELLANAVLGTAKIGIMDAARIGRCGKAANGDIRLFRITLQKIATKHKILYPPHG
jgi:hypothetical protein